MKDDGIVKKTQETIQETIHEKVVPAAKEGLETAQELFGKGANLVGELLKDAGKKTEHVAETAEEVRKDAAKVISRTGEKLIATKNDAMAHFKKNSEETAQKVAKVKEDVTKDAEAAGAQAVLFSKTKAEDLGKAVPKKGKKVVKTAAGMAVLAAAAAGAYAYYKNLKDREEAVKAEFSEKMKKWNEMGDAELLEAETEIPAKMHVRPTKIYQVGQNALLGEDIVVNLSFPGEDLTEFNPDDLAEPINPVEELRKKAELAMGTAGETARRVAETVGDKAKEVYSIASEKADEFKEMLAEKRQAALDEKDSFIQDNEEGLDSMENDLKHGFKEAKKAAAEEAEELFETAQKQDEQIIHQVQDLEESSEDIIQNNREGLEKLTEDLEETFGEAKSAVEDKADDLFENKMESGSDDPTPEENLVENPYGLDEISWEDDESVIMQKTEEIRQKTSEGFQNLKEKLLDAKDYLQERVNRMKTEAEEADAEEFYTEELEVTIHNRGNKDYFFSPMLIQRYNSRSRVTAPVPIHEEGTTLEQRIIKPGETYQGTVVLRKTDSDDAVIMFEDMLMKNSVAILLNSELDDLFMEEESYDMQDDLLFEGIEGDLEDYDFADETGVDLELDDLEVEEAEELSFDFPEEDPNH